MPLGTGKQVVRLRPTTPITTGMRHRRCLLNIAAVAAPLTPTRSPSASSNNSRSSGACPAGRTRCRTDRLGCSGMATAIGVTLTAIVASEAPSRPA